MTSQNDRIKNHLQNVGRISPLVALDLYGCFRLAARIADLRGTGLAIKMKRIKRNGKSFAEYSLG
jgi:hypothetical protein|tara:strand:+ start:284 stop:478 length:195 start_codon:yes stop_codon:yes gene_type:complete